jgi:hypothetical protein
MNERLYHFEELSDDERIVALRRLAQSGMSVFSIAAACSISVEQVRRILGLPAPCEGCDE